MLKEYALERKWQVRHIVLDSLPDHQKGSGIAEEYRVWGVASLVPGTQYPRAEVASLDGAKVDYILAALLHEMGHCEQMDDYGGDRWEWLTVRPESPTPRMPDWYQMEEADAWHRAMRMAGEMGIYWTEDMDFFALDCAFTYGPECLGMVADAQGRPGHYELALEWWDAHYPLQSADAKRISQGHKVVNTPRRKVRRRKADG
jgi:hypothetical protein